MFLTNSEALERGKVCAACPDLNKKLWVCRNCGCFMKVKVRIPSAKCPKGKW